MNVGVGVYVKNSVEAVEFYKEVFGLTLGYNVKNADGTYMHSELSKNENPFICVSETQNEALVEVMLNSSSERARPTTNLGVTIENEEKLRKAYSMLSDGGCVVTPLQSLPWSPLGADVIDKYGVYWYVTMPQHRPADDW